ncbi:MAG TPA: aminopeptidase P family protein [bacterium]|nr:aminopeptidase P family protein [bacterium]
MKAETRTAARGHTARARELLASSDVGALLILKNENRRYVTGFTGSAGLALITPDEIFLGVDFRYEEQAADEAPECTVVRGGRDPLGALAAAVRGRTSRSIGFESEFVPYAQVERLREKFAPAELVPLGTVDRMRWVKDAAEVAAIARAVDIADAAYVHMLDVLRPGLSEGNAALELEIFMRRAGADRLAFETVLASGPRSALPHGRASERIMGAGELVTLDFGAISQGYCSDITRTVALGTADPRQRHIYDVVLDAQLQALAMMRAGVLCRDVDARARAVIAAAGFGEAFGHSLGHGVGLEVHEGPRLSPTEDAALEPGMILTVEPGIYLPGWGGVRIEDLVVVTQDGCRILTHAPKDFRVLSA